MEKQKVDALEVSSLHTTHIKYKMKLKPGQCASLQTEVTYARLENVQFAITKKFMFDFGHVR